MDFELTDDQRMLQDAVQRFVAGEYDFESRKKVLASESGFSETIWRGLAEQGVLGIGLPEEQGGLGGAVEVMVVMEQLGAGLVLEPFLSTVVLGGGLIARHGSPAQQTEILPRIVDGSCRVALAHHEKDARYALDYVNTVARDSGGGYVLSGTKTVVLDGATANVLIVSAREEAAHSGGSQPSKSGSSAFSGAARDGFADPPGSAPRPDSTPRSDSPSRSDSASRNGGGGLRGATGAALSLFVLDPTAPGVEVVSYRTHDGRNAADVKLKDVRVGKDALIGKRGDGLAIVEEALDHGIAALCAESVGIMEALNRATLDYLKTRVQFGQPIGRSQVLQHRMADMFMMAVQARSMSLLATGRVASSHDAALRRHDLSAAKAFIGKAARFIGQQAVQLHGGMGMTAELIVSHYFKRLTLIDATFGDVDHHTALISDQILAEGA
jgi:alkylation response protein AidB-like acyl-CoA dehydrogenase